MRIRSTLAACVFSLLGGSYTLEASQDPDSIVVKYHSFIIEDTHAGFAWGDTVATLYEFPEIIGLADTDTQAKLNKHLKSLVRDTTKLMESERVVPARSEDQFTYNAVKVILVDNNILSYIETDVDAGSVHPNTQVTAMTMDVTTLQPVELDSVFTEGYRDVFERAVRENIADSTLLGSWLDAVAHQYDGRGIVVTDTAVILGRDTEWEFGS